MGELRGPLGNIITLYNEVWIMDVCYSVSDPLIDRDKTGVSQQALVARVT